MSEPIFTSNQLLVALRELVPGIRTKGFKEACVAHLVSLYPDCADLIKEEAKERLNMAPDAYVFNEDGITIFEIEVWHPVWRRAAKVLDAWLFLDDYEVGMQVATVDAYARIAYLNPLLLLEYVTRGHKPDEPLMTGEEVEQFVGEFNAANPD